MTPATSSTAARSSGASRPGYFLPDFCEPRMVLAVVLIAELLAVVLTVGRVADTGFFGELARVSVFVQWTGLTSAALLCTFAPALRRLGSGSLTAAVFSLFILNVIVLSALAVAIGHWLERRGLGAEVFPLSFWPFVLKNVVIALIVASLLLRYFFVSHQWRRHVRAEATARIDALHARIRPHFLFNSLNTIAALTRSDAARAEEAIEDLADLFRATLRDGDAMITLKEELELARIYQRMETLRLGERLRVRWDVAGLPMRARVPSLTVQPLLENAINHGIEPLPDGGIIDVEGWVDGESLHLAVTNPASGGAAAAGPAAGARKSRRGNRIALDNIRDRLALAYGDGAGLAVSRPDGQFRVELTLPATDSATAR